VKILPERLAQFARPFWLPAAPAEPTPDSHSTNEISVVTAFFDIGRSNWKGKVVGGQKVPDWQPRSSETYLEWFGNLARLRNQMVIFTEERFAGRVLELRRAHGLESLTTVMVCEDLLGPTGTLAAAYSLIERAMSPELHELVHNPAFPEFWNADYNLVTALKPCFVGAALDLDLIAHGQVAWVDFGYCRDDQRFDPALPWRFDCAGRMNLFYLAAPDERPVFDIIRCGSTYFQSGVIVGPAGSWSPFRRAIDEAWASLLAVGFVHNDQTPLIIAYRQVPELFHTHVVEGWFVVLQKFDATIIALPPPRGCNLALGKRATQSSVCQWSLEATPEDDASRVVSGHFTGSYNCHTGLDLSPWWRVDLQNIHQISEVRIYNRVCHTGEIVARLNRLELQISDDDRTWRTVFRKDTRTILRGPTGMNPFVWYPEAQISGRYVRIQLIDREYLHLEQVQIYGD